jgi:hypothetical protein
MSVRPEVKPGDWIRIGEKVSAVVCTLYDNAPDKVEVVYLNSKKAINEDVIWTGEGWKFAIEGPCGGYADNYSRLSTYVNILRRGY